MFLLLLILEVLLLKWCIIELTNVGFFFQYLYWLVLFVPQKSWRFHASCSVAGCSLLPAGSTQLRLHGQFQGLGLHWAGVARFGPLWPVTHHVPGEALHRAAAGRCGRQDPPPTWHYRDPLDREPPLPFPLTPSLVNCLHPLHGPLPTCSWARDVWRWPVISHSPITPRLVRRFGRL